jgi:hypothetical protein
MKPVSPNPLRTELPKPGFHSSSQFATNPTGTAAPDSQTPIAPQPLCLGGYIGAYEY